jgi:hypothetical protein
MLNTSKERCRQGLGIDISILSGGLRKAMTLTLARRYSPWIRFKAATGKIRVTGWLGAASGDDAAIPRV